MGIKFSFYVLLPLLLWLFFIKILEGTLFSFYLGDPFLALALVILSFKIFSFWVFLSLFFLGVFKGILLIGEIFWGVIFVLLGLAWEKFEKYFKLEGFKLKLILWSISIFLITLVNLFFFIYRLKIKINLELISSLILKFLVYFGLTYGWTLLLYLVIIKFSKLSYDKVE
ncbi:MAG: hypothetical protein NZ530_00120 [Thermodesulfobacteriaceae bacterium]|nr:hypothetical protein [Thermodesulfobacteriaceae bacterium]MDW8135362.1 hypothetical protein [Thermodesulfobacterium sp.]